MISAIVLAAGKSSRMGEINKLLLPYKKSTILGTVLQELKKSLVGEIIVVSHAENNVYQLVKNDATYKYVVNENAKDGLTTSIQCGIRAADPQASAYLICLGDMPMLEFTDYNLLINSYLQGKNKVILVPVFEYERGNPVLFSTHFKDEILALKSTNGCKPVVLNNPDFVSEIIVDNKHYLSDIDTMKDYNQIK